MAHPEDNKTFRNIKLTIKHSSNVVRKITEEANTTHREKRATISANQNT